MIILDVIQCITGLDTAVNPSANGLHSLMGDIMHAKYFGHSLSHCRSAYHDSDVYSSSSDHHENLHDFW